MTFAGIESLGRIYFDQFIFEVREPMRELRTCVISAPAGLNLSGLRRLLERKGIEVLAPEKLSVQQGFQPESGNIEAADLVIGVLTRERTSQWVLFELGRAMARKKQILLIVYPSAGSIPSDLRGVVTVRTTLSRLSAVEFALEQMLAAPPQHEQKQEGFSRSSRPKDYPLFYQLKQNALEGGWETARQLEELIASILKSAGAEVVVQSENSDRGVDLAVWSDQWETSVGNPLLVEVKSRIDDRRQAENAARQLQHYIGESGTRTGLLVVGQGAEWFNRLPKSKLKQILVLSALDLIQQVEHEDLGTVLLNTIHRKRLA